MQLHYVIDKRMIDKLVEEYSEVINMQVLYNKHSTISYNLHNNYKH